MGREQELREQLHPLAEIGFQEVRTSALVAETLRRAGYQVTERLGGKTGVVGVYDSGVEGPTVGVRADMDALSHRIDGRQVAIHSCGHDGHTAMALAAAEEIMQNGLVKKGKLKMIFQPAEEIGQGAYSIVESGVLDDVDYLFGQHLRPIHEARTGQAIPALYYSAAWALVVDIKGQRAHGARPHLGKNALDAAAAAVMAVNSIHCDPGKSWSSKATRLLCDPGSTNAIPDKAQLTFDTRAESNDLMKQLKEMVESAVSHAVSAYGCTCELTTVIDLPAAEYNDDMVELLRDSIRDVLGEDGLLTPQPTPGGEDFCHYVIAKPHLHVGFFGLGCDLEPGLHDPDMHFDTAALTNGKNILVTAVTKMLGEKK